MPLPRLDQPVRPTKVCGVSTLDSSGRIADAAVVPTLGWTLGASLDMQVRDGLVVITPHPDAVFVLSHPWHLRLPAAVRRRCGLRIGDRVLLVADPPAERLVVHSPAAIEAMLASTYTAVLDGGQQ